MPAHRLPLLAACALVLGLAFYASPAARADSPSMIGCNLSGGEFAAVYPGVLGTHYFYPGAAQFDWAKSQGITLVRIPFRWERVQRNDSSGALHPSLWAPDLAALDSALDAAEARGIRVILDMHNFAERVITIGSAQTTYKIGSPQVSVANYAHAWRLLADHFKDRKSIWGYDIMNEPVGLPGGVADWKLMAQAAVTAIREVDSSHAIILEGYFFAQASSWLVNGAPLLDVVDPAANLVFSAHLYPDNDQSGTWSHGGTVAAELVPSRYPTVEAALQVGVDRVKPFVDWCVAHGVRGLVGEYGSPHSIDVANWSVVLANQLAYMRDHGAGLISGTQWGAGAWSHGYPVRMNPRKNHSNPHPITTVLPAHVTGAGTNYWPPFTWYDDSLTITADYTFSYVYPVTTPATITLTTAHADAFHSGTKSIRLAYAVPVGTAANAGLHTRGPLSIGGVGGVDLSNSRRAGHILSFYAKGTPGAAPRITLARTTDAAGIDTGSITGTGSYVGLATIQPLSTSWQLYEIPLSAFQNAQVDFAPGTTVQRIIFDALPADGSAYEVLIDKITVGLPASALPPVVSADTSSGEDTFHVAEPVPLVATASVPGGSIDYVEFYADHTLVGIDDSAPYEWTTTFTAPGSYPIAAIAIDTRGLSTCSAVKTLLVTDEPPVDIIQDNADPAGVVVTGYWTTSAAPSGYHGANYRHDGNTGAVGAKSIRFTPDLPLAGTYEVYARWTAATNRANNTPVDVLDANGVTHSFSINQRENHASWVSLGTFDFDAGLTGHLTIRNDGANGYVVADAVRWIRR